MRTLLAVGVLLATAACDESPRPTSPTPQPGDPSGAPVARIEVAVDELGSRDAIVALSQVSVDTRGSTGSGALTYAIDFGDGTTATDALARHVYERAGTFTMTANVRDSTGRTASASRQVVVKTLTGRWFHAGYVQRAHQFELRYLTITGQDGLVVRGSFRGPDQSERPFTGRLTSPRNAQIVVDDQTAQLEGVVPGSLNEEGQLWTFQMRGGSVDGERLAFRPVIGEPTGAPPDAVLKIRNDSFGAGWAIQGLSPIQFDGSTSRGDGLSYFIEFGDGEFSTQPTAIHPIDRSERDATWSRMTVVDRFGRTDTEVVRILIWSLVDSPTAPNGCCGSSWFFNDLQGTFRSIKFTARQGLTLTGIHGGQPFVATLSGERDIHIVLNGSGIEFRGHVALTGSQHTMRMVLAQTGGPDHGRIWTFHWDDGPG